MTPHQTTIQRLFRRVSAEELETAFRRIFLHILNTDQEQRGGYAVAIDGKAQRGRLKFEEEQSYPVHAVSLVEHQTGIVLTQGHVEKADVETKSKLTGEQEQEEQEAQKQKSELAVAARLIQHIDWKGKVLTGDALYCQRGLCSALRQAGGDYLFLVKGNQPRLLEDLRVLFAPPAPAKRALKMIDPQWFKLAEAQSAVPAVIAVIWDDRQSKLREYFVEDVYEALGLIGDARAVRPLVAILQTSNYSYAAVRPLEMLLESKAAEFDQEDLQVIAATTATGQLSHLAYDDWEEYRSPHTIYTDCQQLNQLAKQELLRRGTGTS